MAPHDTAEFEAFASEMRPRIDSALDHAVAFLGDPSPLLSQAMRYGLLSPGKRLRPLLTLLAADACGGGIDDAMPAAVAVEMVHAFSLIHDDLPAMDDDDLRRGRPTTHRVYGEAQAILAGDALFAEAFHILASLPDSSHSVRCCRELAEASGALGIAGGQSEDMRPRERPTVEDIECMEWKKTGPLLVCALRMGAIIAHAPDEELAALSAYGRHLGLAFQTTDDLLDLQGSELQAGKRTGKDAMRGKITIPQMIGIAASEERVRILLDSAREALQVFGERGERLGSLLGAMEKRER